MRACTSETIFFAAVCGLLACNSGERAPAPAVVAPVEQPVIVVPDSTVQPAADTPASIAAAAAERAKEWDKVKLEDEVPLCVFADHSERAKAPFLKDVHRQALRADSRVVFGVFPPGCQNEACDSAPTLQCRVNSEEPNTLVVHSRLSFEHKRGTVCTKDCRRVVAGCETAVLKAGKYTVKYGARTFSLRVPSVVRAPCFELD